MRGRSRADRVFRLLLRLFPSEFRGDFGDEMSAVFRDERADATAAGRLGMVRLWWRTLGRQSQDRSARARGGAGARRDVWPASHAEVSARDRRGDTDHRAGGRREHRDVHRRERRAPPTAVRRPRAAGERPPAGCPGPFGADSVDAISNLERACRCRRVARGLHDVVACVDGHGRAGSSQARVLLGQHVFNAWCVAGHRPHVCHARR